METYKTIHENAPPVRCFPAVIECVEGTSELPNSPITGLVLVVSSPGKIDLRLLLQGKGPERLLSMLLAMKEHAPELFQE